MKLDIKLNSLRKKIVLALVAVIVLCAVGSALITNLFIEFQMAGRYRAEKEAAIESLSYSLTAILEARDYQQLKQVITAYLIFENVAYVAVSDDNGTQIEAASQDNVAPAEIQKESHDISSNGQTIGSFEIGFSQTYISDLARRTTWILVFALVSFLLLSGLALYLLMGRAVIQPLEGFARTIRKMNPENLSMRMAVQSDDEIGVLATSFNQMAGDLEKSYLVLHEALEDARLARESRDLAVLEERNRMAREIHDTLAQGFTGIILQLEAAEQALEADANQAQEHINRARQLARESLNEARRSVWALRPQQLEQLSLTAALHRQLESLAQDTGISADFDTNGNESTLTAEIENALLRICQEALANVRKHARATSVRVNLAFQKKVVKLTIDDNGIGFDPSARLENRFGLISMRERTRLLGGSMEIRSEKGKGTRLEIELPLNMGKS